MIKVLISINDLIFARQVEKMIMSFFLCKRGAVADFSLPSGLVKIIEDQDFEYDIALLEIDAGGYKDIIACGKQINDLFPPCQIIYIAADNTFSDLVYDTFHTYYIRKNQIAEMMPKALRKAYKAIEKYNVQYLICNSQRKLVKISMEDIYYIERERHVTNIYTEHNCYRIKETLNKLTRALSVYAPIIRCHVSYYINLRYVESYQSTEFVLCSGRIIPISRKYSKEVKDTIIAGATEQKRYVTFPF